MTQRSIRCIAIAALLGLATFSPADTDDQVPLGHSGFKASVTRPVGFRGDHSGVFPGATPPAHWDERTGKGIKWRTTMPGYTISSPIRVGDKIFTLADPDMLVCCDAETGKIEWVGTTLDVMFPEKLKDPSDQKKWREAYNKEYRYGWSTQKKFWGMLGDIAALLPKDHGLQGFLSQPRVADAKGGGTDQPSVLAKKNSAGARTWEWYWVGNTFTPPISDGKYIYAHFTMGSTVACWDMEGNRQWARKTFKIDEKRSPHLTQELYLHGDLLYVPRADVTWGRGVKDDLLVMDRRTGKTVHNYAWEGKAGGQTFYPFRMDGEDYLFMRNHGRRRKQPSDRILDADTGRVVATLTDMPESDRYGTIGPNLTGFVIRDGVIYSALGGYYYKGDAGATAVKLIKDGDQWRTKLLWHTQLKSDGPTPSWRGIVLVGDEVFVPRGKHTGSFLNAATGEIRKELRLTGLPKKLTDSRDRNNADTYPTVAGKYLYYTSWSGVTAVYDPQQDKIVAENVTAPITGSTLFFHGSHGYLRTLTSLYCLGE